MIQPFAHCYIKEENKSMCGNNWDSAAFVSNGVSYNNNKKWVEKRSFVIRPKVNNPSPFLLLSIYTVLCDHVQVLLWFFSEMCDDIENEGEESWRKSDFCSFQCILFTRAFSVASIWWCIHIFKLIKL